MNTLKIRNWSKWQSYRNDRGQPPWIKIHRCVMRNIEWVNMTDAQRGQLVAIWLLAADHDGVIPASPETIQKLCFMDSIPDIDFYINQGFIEPPIDWRQDGVKETPICHDRIEERREETEKNRSILSGSPDHFDEFYSGYPKKRKPKNAREIWRRKKLNEKADMIIADVKARIVSDKRWIDGFIPDPTTYLNQERWNDEIEKPKQNGNGALWKKSDNELLDLASQLHVSTGGKSRDQLIRDIQAKI